MKNLVVLLSIFLLSLMGCNEDSSTVAPGDDDAELIEAFKSQTGFEKIMQNRGKNSGSDPFEIVDATVKNFFLEITVRYGGGCKEHNFEAFWSGEYYPTFAAPTLAPVILNHQANGEGCEALITQKLKIDLKKLFGEDYSSNVLMPIVLNGSSDQSMVAEKAGKCELEGTVILENDLDACAIYINLDNGTTIEPVDMSGINFDFKHLQRVSLSYTASSLASACMVGQTAKINCIEEIGQGGSVKGIVKDYSNLDGCGFVIELEDGTKLEPAEIMVKDFELRDNQQVWLSYVELKDRVSICMVGKIVRITGIEEID